MTKYISITYLTADNLYEIILGQTSPNVFTFDNREDALEFLIRIAKELYV